MSTLKIYELRKLKRPSVKRSCTIDGKLFRVGGWYGNPYFMARASFEHKVTKSLIAPMNIAEKVVQKLVDMNLDGYKPIESQWLNSESNLLEVQVGANKIHINPYLLTIMDIPQEVILWGRDNKSPVILTNSEALNSNEILAMVMPVFM